MDEYIELEVGGISFKIQRSTLQTFKDSLLANLDKDIQRHCFDRDPALFRHILNAYRSGKVHIPKDVCATVFKEELIYWGIPLSFIAPCCWKYFYEAENDLKTLKVLMDDESQYDSNNKIDPVKSSLKTMFFNGDDDNGSTKQPCSQSKYTDGVSRESMVGKIWLFLEEPSSSTAAKIWLFVYIFVVIVSVLVFIIWLDPSVRVPLYLTDSSSTEGLNITDYINEKIEYMLFTDPHIALLVTDVLCLVFFVTEDIIHFCVCPNKPAYFWKVNNILKTCLCVTMLIALGMEFRKDLMYENEGHAMIYFIVRSLSVLRLLFIFRLHKCYKGLHIILLSLKYSVRPLLLLLFSFAIAVVIYGGLVFSVEIDNDKYPNTLTAMWWSLITITTVGYGDFYPVSWTGYIVGAICAINGIIVIALPVTAIAGVFSDFFARYADYEQHLEEVRKNRKETTANVRSSTDIINKNNHETKQHGAC